MNTITEAPKAKTRTVKIISQHATLLDAVRAAGLDLSYNEPDALSSIKRTQNGHGMPGQGVKAAYVTDEGVYYVYQCDIKILHLYNQYCSCIDNRPMRMCFVTGGPSSNFCDEIFFTDLYIKKTKEGRDWIRSNQKDEYGYLAS